MAAPDYFTRDELRVLPDMGEPDVTDARIDAAAAYVEGVIERVVGTSFVARAKSAALDGGRYAVVLPHAHVLAVTSLSIGGVAQTVGDFAVDSGGLVVYVSGAAFAAGTRNVVVGYSAGYSATPPDDIKEAALWATRGRILETTPGAVMNDRRLSVTDATGGTTTFAVPTEDRPFGFPSVDAVVWGWRQRLSGFGFA